MLVAEDAPVSPEKGVDCMQLLQLVQSLRSAGYFTAVAMTQPFEFEGARKSQAADDLVSAMQDIAHLVAIIEQVCSLAMRATLRHAVDFL